MPNYVPDSSGYDIISGSGPDKQTAGALPDNAYDRLIANPGNCTTHKTPNSVVIGRKLGNSDRVGFFFGSSASFAELSAANKLAAASYQTLVSGSTDGPIELFIHPTAVSSSTQIATSIFFKYNSGLSTGRR